MSFPLIKMTTTLTQNDLMIQNSFVCNQPNREIKLELFVFELNNDFKDI